MNNAHKWLDNDCDNILTWYWMEAWIRKQYSIHHNWYGYKQQAIEIQVMRKFKSKKSSHRWSRPLCLSVSFLSIFYLFFFCKNIKVTFKDILYSAWLTLMWTTAVFTKGKCSVKLQRLQQPTPKVKTLYRY